jgi:hypothetical protein
MWLQNKKTGLKWFIADEDHVKRLLKSGDFEQVEAGTEEKKTQKKAAAKRDEA